MLQTMRSAAKYVWIVLIIAFVGGFLLVDSSGLLGRAPVTTNTVVATVNGEEVLYLAWETTVQNLEQQESQRLGRGVTLDERRELEDQAFNDMVLEILLKQEYARRGITVTDDEIRDAARSAPPPGIEQNPEFQTDGRFDITKYQRFLASPIARQQGLLVGLEGFYRSEIPRRKLFEQLTADVWVSDAQLWDMHRDQNDSARVSYVFLRPDATTASSVSVSDSDVEKYYRENRARFDRPGRALVSLLAVERAVTAVDSLAARARIDALRAEIAAGAEFTDVAQRASDDSVSGANGGELGRGVRGRFVPAFEDAAYALREGELSQPVLSPFGWHLIRVDQKRADTLDLRHILIAIRQSDSTASATDRLADRVSSLAAGATDPAAFDSAASALGLPVTQLVAFEGERLVAAGRVVPSVSAWAFGGAMVGESSDLYDAPDAYYIARLDSLRAGGIAPLAEVKEEIRRQLEREQQIKALVSKADALAKSARSSSLPSAAQALGMTVDQTPMFSRRSLVPGLGQFTEPVGAAFGLTVGAVSAPIETKDGVYVLQLDAFTPADTAGFSLVKGIVRSQAIQTMQAERVQTFVDALKRTASIKDDRKKIQASLRRQAATL